MRVRMSAYETHVGKEGYAVKYSSTGTVALSAAATDLAVGVITNGGATASDIALPGEIVPIKLSGTVKNGQRCQLYTDGTFVVETTGARVVAALCLEDGVSGDQVRALILPPQLGA